MALHLVLVGRYFERIADHAVNIAERMRYFVTGDEEHLNERAAGGSASRVSRLGLRRAR